MGVCESVFGADSEWVYFRTLDTKEDAEKVAQKLSKREKCETKIVENKDTFTVVARKK